MKNKIEITEEKYWMQYFGLRFLSILVSLYFLLLLVFENDKLSVDLIPIWSWTRIAFYTLIILKALFDIVKSESYKYFYPFRWFYKTQN